MHNFFGDYPDQHFNLPALEENYLTGLRFNIFKL